MSECRERIVRTARYERARSCQHCTDTGDSFGRYVSTYCHLRHEHMAGLRDVDTLEQCFSCKDYQKRKDGRK